MTTAAYLTLGVALSALLTACATGDVGTDTTATSIAAQRNVAVKDTGELWTSRAIARPVMDNRGAYIGNLVDFVIDVQTGEVRYAVLSDQRLAGGELFVAAPVRTLSSISGDDLFLDTSGAWQTVPVAGYGHRLSRLIGRYVTGADGLQLGRIGEAMIDTDRQRVRHVVLFYEPRAGAAPTEHAFAVPLEALSWSSHGVTLNVSKERLASLIGTDADERTGSAGVRYLGAIDRSFPLGVPRPGSAIGGTR